MMRCALIALVVWAGCGSDDAAGPPVTGSGVAKACLTDTPCKVDGDCPDTARCNKGLQPPRCHIVDCSGVGEICDPSAVSRVGGKTVALLCKAGLGCADLGHPDWPAVCVKEGCSGANLFCPAGAQDQCACRPGTDYLCSQSLACWQVGACTLVPDGCRAAGDGDCLRSKVCRDEGRCQFDPDGPIPCVKARP